MQIAAESQQVFPFLNQKTLVPPLEKVPTASMTLARLGRDARSTQSCV